jgi:hypothetical protein
VQSNRLPEPTLDCRGVVRAQDTGLRPLCHLFCGVLSGENGSSKRKADSSRRGGLGMTAVEGVSVAAGQAPPPTARAERRMAP